MNRPDFSFQTVDDILASCKKTSNITGIDDDCPICLQGMRNDSLALPYCGHAFHNNCLNLVLKSQPICPICRVIYIARDGNQPPGTMTVSKLTSSLPGFSDFGTIEITYSFSGGIQSGDHPFPGQPYNATSRVAYLPDSKDGNEILELLRKAFNKRLIFTIGRSLTTNVENSIIWNGIHHKTSTSGGESNHGYPDENYLSRVRDELASKGIWKPQPHKSSRTVNKSSKIPSTSSVVSSRSSLLSSSKPSKPPKPAKPARSVPSNTIFRNLDTAFPSSPSSAPANQYSDGEEEDGITPDFLFQSVIELKLNSNRICQSLCHSCGNQRMDLSSDYCYELPFCGHILHEECLQAVCIDGKCPICSMPYITMRGNQPHGTMTVKRMAPGQCPLSGHENHGTLLIDYVFPAGIQGSNHPSPGTPYPSDRRTAYLPDTPEGQEILALFEQAFDRKLMFTIGTSLTTGRSNVIVWNGIINKTQCYGGARNYGYPDDDYFEEVRKELNSRGVL